MRCLWLPNVLIAAGLPVTTVPGWNTRGSELAGIDGVVGHHTASAQGSGNAPSLLTCIKGRPDLPGPLCSALLARDGTWMVIASGVGNHAGTGRWPGFRGGNHYTLGVEAENSGVGEPWPTVQMDSYARGVAAILAHLGETDARFCAHYEWALPRGRKIDPAGPWVGGGDWYTGRTSVLARKADGFRTRLRVLLEGDTMTDEEHTWLREVHDMLTVVTKGAPAYGVEPVPPQVSKNGRMLDKILAHLGIT